MSEKKVPTGRVQRFARVGAAAASQAVKQTGTRAANVARSEERADEAMERRQIEAARQIVTVLGGMKGAAMKVGQVLSFLDFGVVPEAYREEFQAELAKLRDSAPQVSFEQMRKVIEEDLEEGLSANFSDFDEDAIAAASIGQVYRATLTDGREVAVKVQYPGINEAVRADLKNLGLIMRLIKRITPGLNVKAIGEEVRDRVVEELDYELEASNQRTMARLYRDHPFIVIPDVVTSLCRERVIVSDLVEGDGFEKLRTEPDAERDRIGEIVFRFYYGSMFRHGRFSGDPHPGNMLRRPDGRIAFLDFGLFKAVAPETTEKELACQRAVCEEDPERLHRLLSEYGFIPEPEKLDPQVLWDYIVDGIWWYTQDQSVRLTREIASTVAIGASDPRSRHFRAMRHQDIVPEHLFGRRLELLTLAVLGMLEAEANWYRIAREWMYGDDPVTELGRQEAEFYASRPLA
jgi:predicted unusual protein kinase regulating ubiquinone biosynthesis (AarF/ABC1/UbiB family)